MLGYLLIYFSLSLVCLFAQPVIQDSSLKIVQPNKSIVTNQPFLDNNQWFQFIIVSDRTGGMRGGVFAEAIQKINLLQPEFVISIGDLVDGYTENNDIINAQWNEFFEIIGQLQMPFYFIPGNHDISNDFLENKWQQLFGRTYYHFVYKSVLFLCLNTEDPPGKGISPEQISYFRNVLQTNTDTYWTLIFMHKPLWAYGDQQGFQDIRTLLKGKYYTVFSGHHHHYLKSEKDSSTFYTLATTGGGSNLRGIDLGEFDHIMWISMTDKGPVVANLLLSGIVADNPVTDETNPMIQTLRTGSWFKISPYIHPEKQFTQISIRFIFENPTDHKLIITGLIPATHGLTYEPDSIFLEVIPNSSLTANVQIKAEPTADISSIALPTISLTGSYILGEDRKISVEASKKLLLDWQHTCPGITGIAIDGNVADWPEYNFIDCKSPQYIKEDWDWHGMTDGYFRFATACDAEYIYLIAQSQIDDSIIIEENHQSRQDKFILSILPGYTSGDTEFKQIDLVLARNGFATTLQNLVTEYAFNETDNSICAELKLSRKIFGPDFKNFRLNIAWIDHDNPANIKPSELWWRPPWNSALSYDGSGVFILR